MENQFQNASQLSTVYSPQGLWRNIPAGKALELPASAQGRAHSDCMAAPEPVTSKCFPACPRAQHFQLSSSSPPWIYFQPSSLTAAQTNMQEVVSSLLRTPEGELPRPQSNLALNTPRDPGAATPSLGNLRQGLSTLRGQNSLPISHPSLPCLSGKACPVPVGPWLKSLSSSLAALSCIGKGL